MDVSSVPSAYHHLREVFSKDCALSLPPHRPYDCGIDLLPNVPYPSSKLYNLSKPERDAMETYITDSLATGLIYLDDILIFSRNLQEHVQHVNLVLKRLLENRLYVKAEKCDFHVSSVCFLDFIVEKGQIKTDPAEWPTPTSRKQLQRFLGFANFYRRFIRDYSRVATPLTQLTSVKIPFVLHLQDLSCCFHLHLFLFTQTLLLSLSWR